MIRRWIVILASLGLVAVWGTAAFLKSLDPAAFAEQISLHRITPDSWSPALAYLFIGLETFLAAAHLAFFRPRLAFLGSGLLLVGFMGITGWAWAHGNAEACGCFGRLASRGPQAVILEDAGFLVLPLVGLALCRDFRAPRWSGRAFAGLVPLAVILPVVGPHLPGDSLVTTFNPGEDMTHLAADDLPVMLDQGQVLLVLIGDPCPACDEGLSRLDQIAGRDGAPSVVAVFSGTRREAREWALNHVPAYGVASAPEKVLKQYYRRLPQVALLDKGIIRSVWRGRVPTWEEVRAAAARS